MLVQLITIPCLLLKVGGVPFSTLVDIYCLSTAGSTRPPGSHSGGTGMWPPPAPPQHFDRSALPANLRPSSLPRPGQTSDSQDDATDKSTSSRPPTGMAPDGDRPPSSRHPPGGSGENFPPRQHVSSDGESPSSRQAQTGPRLDGGESRPDQPPRVAVATSPQSSGNRPVHRTDSEGQGRTGVGTDTARRETETGTDVEEGEVEEMEDGEASQPSSQFGRLALSDGHLEPARGRVMIMTYL